MLGALLSRYGIDCFYIGDTYLEDLGLCSLYLPLDARFEYEKTAKDFKRLLFEVDGSIIEGISVNSSLLSKCEIEAFVKSLGLKLNLDSSVLIKKDLKNGNVVYEVIAITEPNIDI